MFLQNYLNNCLILVCSVAVFCRVFTSREVEKLYILCCGINVRVLMSFRVTAKQ